VSLAQRLDSGLEDRNVIQVLIYKDIEAGELVVVRLDLVALNAFFRAPVEWCHYYCYLFHE
jgi:hypothetical protein